MRKWFNVDAWFQDRAVRQAEEKDVVMSTFEMSPGERWHVWDLCEATSVPASRIYSILASLEAEGRIYSDFHIHEHHQRRFYSLREIRKR